MQIVEFVETRADSDVNEAGKHNQSRRILKIDRRIDDGYRPQRGDEEAFQCIPLHGLAR